MSSTPQENLAIHADKGQLWMRCSRCQHVYCPADQSWQEVCHVRYIPVPKVEPFQLVTELLSDYRLKEFCCPSCGVLLHVEMVEAKEAHDAA